MTFTPGTQLGPYEIVSQLGSGGMGVVYTAKDPRLKRTVAIKLLPPDLTRDDIAKQRFLQEAQAASALDHPNICTIFEINETDDGQLYLVMAHYEGETLKERIERGPVALDDAIDIATQVGQGLAEAHSAGIVHRDIKPANLLVTKTGVVKILDFGLAKLAGSEGVTQTGTTVGTVAYMSPEQARGQEVDHRTDIWSLGVVLYEMLAGTPPFQGENLLSLADAIRSREPEPVGGGSSSLNPTLSRAMNKDVGQRYQSVAELLSGLRTPQSGSDPVTVAISAQADVPSIAVLPFANMSADPEQEYFCDGLAEELIDALARLEGLRVVARTSAFQFRGKGFDLIDVGEKLKVKTILEGSVRTAGNRLRINAQLINAGDGYHLWSERYDRELDDVFDVQEDIARTVVAKLKVELLGTTLGPLMRRGTDDVETHDLCVRGRYHHWRLTADGFDAALRCFEQALERDPGCAQAHAGVASVYTGRAILGLGAPQELFPKAKAAAGQAIAIDDEVRDAHFLLAQVHQHFDWDWLGAEQEFRRELEVNPGNTEARSLFSIFLLGLRSHDAAIREARRATEHDPLSDIAHHMLAQVLLGSGRVEEAIKSSRRGVEVAGGFTHAYWSLGSGLSLTEQHDEALAVLREAVSVSAGDLNSLAHLAWACGRAGLGPEAMDIARQLEEDLPGFAGVLIAVVFVGLNDHDTAFQWLSKAFEGRDAFMGYLPALVQFDPLRSDPRFQALLQRMNFPQQP